MQTDIKYCQSCIERGYKNPQPATREYMPGLLYCEDCFTALINNMMAVAPGSVEKHNDNFKEGPILPQIYQMLNIPKELQFDSVDKVCRFSDKIYNFHAPANINKTIEETGLEIEQLSMCLFHFQFKIDTLKNHIDRLKEQRRQEKGLKSYDDSAEKYAKVKKPTEVKKGQEKKVKNSLANLTGGDVDVAELLRAGQELEKKKRMREFWILSDNCPECGGAKPCKEHPNAKII